MLSYTAHRFLNMVLLMLAMSIVSFIVIQLPPGDYLTSYIIRLQSQGARVTDEQVASLKKQYDLDLPFSLQYVKWVWKMLHGDFGISFEYNRPTIVLLKERLPLTMAVSMVTVLFAYSIAIPIGVYSAVHQNTITDYLLTILGFVGASTPNFLLALILMFTFYKYLGIAVGGLFSPAFENAPWSLARLWDMLKKIWVPVIVVGVAGTARVIRVMRACLLDELRKQYVTTARAKGLAERTLFWKYPVRIAMNPIISTLGWLLPWIISGSTVTAVVLNLPTVGPLLLKSLLSQDMYLAGSVTMTLAFVTMLGTFLSDILLAWSDPRIRLER